MQNQNQKANNNGLNQTKTSKGFWNGFLKKFKTNKQTESVLENKKTNSTSQKEEIKIQAPDTNLTKQAKTEEKRTEAKSNFFSVFLPEKKKNISKTTIEPKTGKTEKINSKQTSVKDILAGLFQKNAKNNSSNEQIQNKELEEAGKKNLFVDLFPQESGKISDDSLIETIVEQSDKKQSILGQKLNNKKVENMQPTTTEEANKGDLLFISYLAITIAILIPTIVFVFFYYKVTPSSKILGMFEIKNTGMLYVEKSAEKENLQNKIQAIKADLLKLETTSPQVLMEQTIQQIKANTNDWLEVLDYIKEVTNQGVRYNDRLKRVVYKSYNFILKDNQITLNAEIFDPNKQVFNLATSLIDSINASEYFQGMENRNFSKSVTSDGAKMSLTMNFNFIPQKERENLTTVLEK